MEGAAGPSFRLYRVAAVEGKDRAGRKTGCRNDLRIRDAASDLDLNDIGLIRDKPEDRKRGGV